MTSEIHLGSTQRAKKYASSVCIWSKHSIRTVTEEEILNDLQVLNRLYYDYIFEVYSNNDVISENNGNDNNTGRNSGTNRRNIISREMRIQQEKRNAETGIAAEQYVFEKEREYLITNGLIDLANKIKWVAKDGDGHGYDIESYNDDGTKKYIEVKGSRRSDENYFLHK
ncbi:DUF3883 domain-containing protein [Brevibacillus laterosporus]|uniref:DUF3883 domain-containing protein n=1 Tax=Brevibacillus laterosporus TaxID=1465 RepID=UPI0003B203AE|nr:DUF3883 domain-containing protein [Brevibacillus laterosporus]ERM19680.1 hypothetical protein P615_10035 [Brevibacillus laterosporus PE36]